MMTTDEVNEYLARQKAEAENKGQETEVKPDGGADPQPADEETGAEETETRTDGADGGEVHKPDGEDEGGTPEGGEPEKKPAAPKGGEPDGAEQNDLEKNKARWAASFRKEKEKRQRQKERYEREIAVKNKEIAELKAKLGDGAEFKADKENIQTLVSLQAKESEVSRLTEEREQVEMEDAIAENERRVNACFPDEEDRKIYNTLLQNSGEAFVKKLDAVDPDGVILGCLDDCEISPIVLRVLMTRPKFLNDILSKKTRHGKELAFDSLVNQCRVADKIVRSNKAKKQTSQGKGGEEANKKPLDNVKPTGRNTKAGAEGGTGGPVVKNAAYWNDYLKNHPRGR